MIRRNGFSASLCSSDPSWLRSSRKTTAARRPRSPNQARRPPARSSPLRRQRRWQREPRSCSTLWSSIRAGMPSSCPRARRQCSQHLPGCAPSRIAGGVGPRLAHVEFGKHPRGVVAGQVADQLISSGSKVQRYPTQRCPAKLFPHGVSYEARTHLNRPSQVTSPIGGGPKSGRCRSSSISRSLLYFARRSPRAGAPDLI